MTPETESTIKPGDIVKLKSGGPEMTVMSIEERPTSLLVKCAWFHEGSMKSEAFLGFMLVRAGCETVADLQSFAFAEAAEIADIKARHDGLIHSNRNLEMKIESMQRDYDSMAARLKGDRDYHRANYEDAQALLFTVRTLWPKDLDARLTTKELASFEAYTAACGEKCQKKIGTGNHCNRPLAHSGECMHATASSVTRDIIS